MIGVSIQALNHVACSYHSKFRVFRGVDSKLEPLSHGGQGGSVLTSQDGRGQQDLREQGARMCRHQVAGLVLTIESVNKLGQLLSVKLLLQEGYLEENQQVYFYKIQPHRHIHLLRN